MSVPRYPILSFPFSWLSLSSIDVGDGRATESVDERWGIRKTVTLGGWLKDMGLKADGLRLAMEYVADEQTQRFRVDYGGDDLNKPHSIMMKMEPRVG